MTRNTKPSSVKYTVYWCVPLLMAALCGGCATSKARPGAPDRAPHRSEVTNPDAPTPETLYAMARAFLHQGNEHDGETVLRSLIAEHPEFSASYSDLAELQMRQGKCAEAKQTLLDGLRAAPSEPVLLNNMGVWHLMQADYAHALDFFTKATDAGGPDPQYLANRALALGRLGRYDESLALYKQILPESAAEHNVQVIREMHNGQASTEQPSAKAEKPKSRSKRLAHTTGQ